MIMGKRILIVDDEPDVSKLLSLALRKSHYDVLVAENGQSALDHAAAFRPDLILLDLKLPDFDGYMLFDRFKKDPATAAVPVVFITAFTVYGNEDVSEKTKRMGAAGCFYKPFEFRDLKTTLETLLV
jgi:DNA-binding response OmpR family regulator